jgi:adenylate cyclase
VCIAGTVKEHVTGKLPYLFEDAGEQQVKNIARAVHVFRLRRERAGATPTPAVGSDDLPLPSKPSVAVLPFTNMSGDAEQEYFSDGITEDIITELSRNRGLFVIARNSSFAFKGPAVDIAEVGRKLGVRYVVEGSVRKAGKRIRITAQLVEAATGNHVWAERYDRDLEDIFAVQDEVTERIVWALIGSVTRREIDRSKRRTDPRAYDLLLRGMDLVMRSAMEDMDRPAELFREALRLDPTLGRAKSWLALAHYSASWELGKYEERMQLAVETAMRAMELDDPEDWTESIIAQVFARRGDFETASVHMDRAMLRNPASTLSLSAKGFIKLWYGRAEEALSIGEKLRRLDPLFAYWHDDLLAYANYQLGDYQTAMEQFRRAMPVRWFLDYAYIAACLGQLGQTEEAQAMWHKALQTMPGFSVAKFKETMASRTLEYRERWLDGLRKAGIET